jgi:hypothetical protein
MDWLKDHAYLAGWISLPIMVVLGLVQGIRFGFVQMKFKQLVIYFVLLACIAAVFTSPLEFGARAFGGGVAFILLIYLMCNAD